MDGVFGRLSLRQQAVGSACKRQPDLHLGLLIVRRNKRDLLEGVQASGTPIIS